VRREWVRLDASFIPSADGDEGDRSIAGTAASFQNGSNPEKIKGLKKTKDIGVKIR
jgi:hypothetical protein